jgi:uncharacterized protein YqgC (DUF456 family)
MTTPLALSVPSPLAIFALLVLLAAVVSAFVPGLPTGIVSLVGVSLYWWSTGFVEPDGLVLAVLVVVCLLALCADWFGGLVAAKVGGASTLTTVVAGGVGLALLFVTGPVGMILGSASVVFALEYRKHRDAGGSAVAAGAYVVGFFASAVVQAFLAFTVFVSVLWIAIL